MADPDPPIPPEEPPPQPSPEAAPSAASSLIPPGTLTPPEVLPPPADQPLDEPSEVTSPAVRVTAEPKKPSMIARLGWVGAVILLPFLVLWPAPISFWSDILSAPDQEAVQHLWGLWAALKSGDVLFVHSDRLSWPIGFDFVLIDPGNLLPFALGHFLLGPVAGFNAVLIFGVMLVGVAGALLTRAAGGRGPQQTVGAVAAMACPAVLSSASEGITESFGVGWCGIALAALLLHLQDPRRGWRGWIWGAIAAVTLAWSVTTGPYNGLWSAMLALGVSAWNFRRWRRTLPVGAVALLLALPFVLAFVFGRDDGLPGTVSRIAWETPYADPLAFRGGFKLGADLTDPFLPAPITGGAPAVGHTAYVGLCGLVLALIALMSARDKWTWLAGAAFFLVLSLGPWLIIWGHPIPIGSGYLVAPLGLLAQVLPFVLRLTRWYRAAAVAGLLIAPLIGLAVPRPRFWRRLCSIGLLADSLVLSPRAWPIVHFDARASPIWASLERPGAIVDLPPVQWWFLEQGGIRDENLLQQTWHGRPNNGTFFNLSGGAADSDEVLTLMYLAIGRAAKRGDAVERLSGLGYSYVVIDRTRFQHIDTGPLEARLGRPVVRDAHYLVYELPRSDVRVQPEFPPWSSPQPPPGTIPGEGAGFQEGPGGHRQGEQR